MPRVVVLVVSVVCASALVAQTPVVFTDVTAAANLGNTFTGGGTSHSGGAAWVDYNNDLLDDLLITNGTNLQPHFYRNNGDGTFTDLSSIFQKPQASLEIAGVLYADVENDGDNDILMIVDRPMMPGVAGGPNLFYVNQGDGTFVEQAAQRGLVDPLGRRNNVGGFADFNRDGFIDLFIETWDPSNLQMQMPGMMRFNDGAGGFVDVTSRAGANLNGRNTLGCLVFDSNHDQWPDVYVGNTGEFLTPPLNSDVFYVFDSGLGKFTDVTANSPGIGDDARAPMGMDVADVDADGYWDLYITDTPITPPEPRGNVLYFGRPDGRFSDNRCDAAGVCTTNPAWPCKFEDFNLDGWVDLWVGTLDLSNDHLFVNNRNGTFSPSASQAALQGNLARGGTTSDYDGDGDIDIVVVNFSQKSRLIRNDTVAASNWLEFKLYGTTSNRDAIGAVVTATIERVATTHRVSPLTQMRRVTGGDSAHSQASLIVHFGLAESPHAYVTVRWPSGKIQHFDRVAANQLVLVDESLGIVSEALTHTTATWSKSSKTVSLSVSCNYGGRAAFTCPLGVLAFNAATGQHEATYTGVPRNPLTLELVSTRGAYDLVVTEVP